MPAWAAPATTAQNEPLRDCLTRPSSALTSRVLRERCRTPLAACLCVLACVRGSKLQGARWIAEKLLRRLLPHFSHACEGARDGRLRAAVLAFMRLVRPLCPPTALPAHRLHSSAPGLFVASCGAAQCVVCAPRRGACAWLRIRKPVLRLEALVCPEPQRQRSPPRQPGPRVATPLAFVLSLAPELPRRPRTGTPHSRALAHPLNMVAQDYVPPGTARSGSSLLMPPSQYSHVGPGQGQHVRAGHHGERQEPLERTREEDAAWAKTGGVREDVLRSADGGTRPRPRSARVGTCVNSCWEYEQKILQYFNVTHYN